MKAIDFTSNPEVLQAIQELKDFHNGRKVIISDVIDEQGNQYVDLVQEGGGVLGVALLGYIYVLEEFGIRFMNLAGTSAGAITTLLLAAVHKPNEKKSARLIELVANKNFYDFVDGKRSAKALIKETLGKKRKFYLFLHTLRVLKTLKKHLGLNPGNNLLEWTADVLKENEVQTVAHLKAKMKSSQNLKLRSGVNGKTTFKSEIKIIASDLTTNTKAIFPEMGDLYYEDIDSTNPSEFIRASMSIPFFFAPFKVPHIPNDNAAKANWEKKADYHGRIPNEVVFVDGGVMSNFPIDLFHNKNTIPRKPTLGIKLGVDRASINPINNVFQLGYSAFESARQIRDFEFIFNNPDFKELVTYVDLKEFNWLDFNLSPDKKIALFTEGVKAACDFLKKFDWPGYKKKREQLLFDEFVAIAKSK